MLARSKAGTEASQQTYAARLAVLRDLLASWPTDLTMKDIRERIEADAGRNDRKPDSIIRRMREHRLIVFDLVSGCWHNLCRVAPPSNPLNL
jgi:transposase